MTRMFPAGLAVLCAFIVAPALAGSPAPKTKQRPACSHALHSAEGQNALVRSAWDHKKIRKRDGKIQRVRHNTTCPKTLNAKRHIKGLVKDQRKRYKRAKAKADANWCAPNPHPLGEGCWVIPAYCVRAESGGSWTAHNPSSPARGPYQLLGHGEPWPVVTQEQAMEHHRIAANLEARGGSGPWVAGACSW